MTSLSVMPDDITAIDVERGARYEIGVRQIKDRSGRVTNFADPVELERYFDALERDLLGENGFFNWLRAVFFPTTRD